LFRTGASIGPADDSTARANRSASLLPCGIGIRNSDRAAAGCATGTPLPDRTSPSAMVHSKTAMLKSEHAARTSISARTSSTVSMTTMGVEELMRTFSRSSGLGDGLGGEFIGI